MSVADVGFVGVARLVCKGLGGDESMGVGVNDIHCTVEKLLLRLEMKIVKMLLLIELFW